MFVHVIKPHPDPNLPEGEGVKRSGRAMRSSGNATEMSGDVVLAFLTTSTLTASASMLTYLRITSSSSLAQQRQVVAARLRAAFLRDDDLRAVLGGGRRCLFGLQEIEDRSMPQPPEQLAEEALLSRVPRKRIGRSSPIKRATASPSAWPALDSGIRGSPVRSWSVQHVADSGITLRVFRPSTSSTSA